MKISINYADPLSEEQNVLNDICSKIEQKIVLKSNKNHGGYFSAVASFDEEGSSEFYGYAERDTSELKTMLKAQICAVTNLLKSSGYEVSFLLSSSTNETSSSNLKLSSINRFFITSAPDVDYSIKELEKLGVDTTAIKAFRDELVEKGERLTKNKLSDFMFPPRSKAVLSVVKEEEKVEKRPAMKKPIKAEELQRKYTAARTPDEAQELMNQLKAAGIDEKTYNTLIEKDEYNSLILFCLYAKEEQVNKLLK